MYQLLGTPFLQVSHSLVVRILANVQVAWVQFQIPWMPLMCESGMLTILFFKEVNINFVYHLSFWLQNVYYEKAINMHSCSNT
jgi:hypothetical protein